ncbi:MAG: hypothetical protein JST80_02495 [Bdellovibrionales bacterium]|nr:hypothetical protein [Bdellovibrionales bacterium]
MREIPLYFSVLFIAFATQCPVLGQVVEPGDDVHEWGEKFELAPGVKAQDIDYFRDYQPSVITTEAEVKFLSKTMRGARSFNSQCFNRAEVWAYEASNRYREKFGTTLNMVKVFRFYSNTYMSGNKFDWWFHVAPGFFVEAMGSSRTFTRDQIMVMDNRAYKDAVPFSDWDRYFFNMTGNKTVSNGCRHVRSYFEYTQLRDSPNEDCFDLIVPMYVYTPDDFGDVEKKGKAYPEQKWDLETLSEAYRQAGLGRVREY